MRILRFVLAAYTYTTLSCSLREWYFIEKLLLATFAKFIIECLLFDFIELTMYPSSRNVVAGRPTTWRQIFNSVFPATMSLSKYAIRAQFTPAFIAWNGKQWLKILLMNFSTTFFCHRMQIYVSDKAMSASNISHILLTCCLLSIWLICVNCVLAFSVRCCVDWLLWAGVGCVMQMDC